MKVVYFENTETLRLSTETLTELYQIGQLSVKFPNAPICNLADNTKEISLPLEDVLRELTNRANAR